MSKCTRVHVLVHTGVCRYIHAHVSICVSMCPHTCTVRSRVVVTPSLMSWLLEAHTEGISSLSTLEATEVTG